MSGGFFNYQTINEVRNEKNVKAYSSTGSTCLDFFYEAATLRTSRDLNEATVNNMFGKAFNEDPLTAMKLWFWVGDVRSGQGERFVRRAILKFLANNYKEFLLLNLQHIPEFFRWDDLIISGVGTKSEAKILDFITEQLRKDYHATTTGGSVSLLAKWLPSENTSSKQTVALAKRVMKYMHLKPAEYRKMLSELRRKIKIVERDMSANRWSVIDYNIVPSRASFIYRKAFGKHDNERYVAWLAALKRGDKGVKINAATMYPYDLVGKYLDQMSSYLIKIPVDETIEAQWRALPNWVGDGYQNAICLIDTSGSMFTFTKPQSIDIAVSLGLYFAERNKGYFKNKFISFTTQPKLINIRGETLLDRVGLIAGTDWAGSTNFHSAIRLLLDTAIREGLTQEEMPATLYIISDMQFDTCDYSYKTTDLQGIQKAYQEAGYTMPNIVFWNCRATGTKPTIQFKHGVAMVGGFSPSLFKSLVLDEINPIKIMMAELSRYDFVRIPAATNDN